MTTGNTPPRRPLSSFLQGPSSNGDAGADAGAGGTAAAMPAAAEDIDAVETTQATAESTDIAPAANAEEAPAASGTGEEPLASHPLQATPDPAPTDPATVIATAPVTPSFLRGTRPAPIRTPRWQWGLAAALGALLLVQIAVADRASLAANARTRPLVGALCTVLRCALPAWHEPAAFTMLQREVRPLPERAGVLQVQASFRNDARWAQDWPALRLSLSDADGRVIGRRTLQPGDYLGPAHDPQQRLEPGQSAQVAFQLREPAAGTVAYDFEFR